MRRNNTNPLQRGSSSILFAVVVLPLLLMMLAVGAEVSQFFGIREEVLAGLDAEMMSSLRANENGDAVADRVRGRLTLLRPYLLVEEVRVRRSGVLAEGIVRGSYRGPLLEVASRLAGSSVGGVPIEVVASARRPRAATLILLDRTIGEQGDPCGDVNLIARAEAAAHLAARLRSAGMAGVTIGVFPGARREIDLIGDGDIVPRCPGGDASMFGVRGIRGVPEGALPDPISIALGIVETVSNSADESYVEQRSVIMLAPLSKNSEERVTTSATLLENEAARQRISLQTVGLVVDERGDGDLLSVKSSSGRSAYVRVSREDLRGAFLETALLHHIQGRIMIAR